MKEPTLKPRQPWKRALGIIGAMLVLVLATHPELRVLAPLFDAVGFEALVMLIGAQMFALFSGTLKPVLLATWQRAAPWLSAADRFMASSNLLGSVRDTANRILGDYSGVLGQYLWAGGGRCWQLACLGPRADTEKDVGNSLRWIRIDSKLP